MEEKAAQRESQRERERGEGEVVSRVLNMEKGGKCLPMEGIGLGESLLLSLSFSATFPQRSHNGARTGAATKDREAVFRSVIRLLTAREKW